MAETCENEHIRLFQEYLQIRTISPNSDWGKCLHESHFSIAGFLGILFPLEPCLQYLQKRADEIGLPMKTYRPMDEKNPVVVMTWLGTEPSLQTIVLNSHNDVVPTNEKAWTHPPFAAEIDSKGQIFARGSQDMKCVGLQYLIAIKSLKESGFVPKRTIHLIYVPGNQTLHLATSH